MSGFRMKIFSALGVASIAVESNFRELLENGNRSLIGSRGRAFE
jgi:hypothetical protein